MIAVLKRVDSIWLEIGGEPPLAVTFVEALRFLYDAPERDGGAFVAPRVDVLNGKRVARVWLSRPMLRQA